MKRRVLRSGGIHLQTALIGAMLLVWSASSAAAGTTLTWNPNPEPDIAGYVVFYGTSPGQYVVSVDVGNQTFFELAGLASGSPYFFAVRAYNQAGLQSELSPEVSTAETVSTLALTGIAPSKPAPQIPGTAVTFIASATGGVSPPQYKWLIFDGSTWRAIQNWSTSNTFEWNPTVTNANYRVGAWARSATSTADAPDNPSAAGYIPFPIVQALVLTDLSASLPSPQPVGASITFTASASGGVEPHQYKWLVSNGIAWNVARDWSSSNTFSWTPTVASSNYSVGVWVRSATSTIDAPENANAGSSLPFAITGNVTLTSLTANKSAPQLSGSKILFTATASGASSYQYKWWVGDGTSAWTVAQEWSSSNKFMWAPTNPNANYQVIVRVQDGSNPSQSSGASLVFPILPASGNGKGGSR